MSTTPTQELVEVAQAVLDDLDRAPRTVTSPVRRGRIERLRAALKAWREYDAAHNRIGGKPWPTT